MTSQAVRNRVLVTVGAGVILVLAGFLLPPGQGGERIVGGPFSLAPPVLAILLAVIWRRVLTAMLAGLVMGALLTEGFHPGAAVWTTVSGVLLPTVTDVENLKIFAFTFLLMGMVGILIVSGGIEGVVRAVSRFARGRRSGQTLVASLGCAVFFDDYANTVVVGSSARPITDRLGISREKLAYIVDSTAAPVASLAVVSTWIGIEVRYLDEQMVFFGDVAATGYGVFLSLIPLRFYCWFALMLVFLVALTGRDFGPMLRAERRAVSGHPEGPGRGGGLSAGLRALAMRPGSSPNAWFGLIPVLGVLVTILVTFFLSGAAQVQGATPSPFRLSGWKDAFAAVQDSTSLLVLAGGVGTMLAVGMSVVWRKLTLFQSLGAWWSGARSLGVAVALLVLAISLRKVTDADHLDSAGYVLAMLSGTTVWLVPLVVFLAASGIAFATGTSWGTMGILIPFAVPLAAQAAAESGQPMLLLLATGAVLDGAVFGDHCSPISDTTVLSAVGSSCDLMEHVKTQAPYALAAMVVAGLVGYLGMALEWWDSGVAWLLGCGILFLFIRFTGRKVQ